MTDQAIIEHLRSNRYSNAVKGLYNAYPAVKKYILVNNGSKEDAEDIFQDSLVILYKNANKPEFSLSSSLQTYLLAITKNLWREALRKKGRLPLIQDETEIVDNTEPGNEGARKVAELAFNFLGKKCKELLIAFYFKKDSYQQIAKLLRFSSEKVVKNQKYRCLQKAKENYAHLIKNGLA